MNRVSVVLAAAIVLLTTMGASAASEGDAIAQLRRYVPPALKGTCERLTLGDSAVRVRGATGALVCTPGGRIEDVGLYLFDDPYRLDDWWVERFLSLDEPLGPGDCSEGVAGFESTPVGQVACYRTRGIARIRWFDKERLLYGSVDSTRRNIEGVFDWWVQNVAGSDTPNEAILAPSTGPLVTWQRVERAPGFGGVAEISQVSLSGAATAAGGDSVAVGYVIDEPLAWHSEDGLEWSEVVLPGSQYGCHSCTPSGPGDPGLPIDVVALDGGFVAIGNTVDRPDSEGKVRKRPYGLVWTSDTGSRWTGPQEIPDGRFERLIVTPEGLAIIGLTDPTQKQRWRGVPTIWTSLEGMDWTAQPIDERRGRAVDLAWSPSGVRLARGSRLWRSTDGDSWVELTVPDTDAKGRRLRLTGPVWTPTGFVLAATATGNQGDRSHSELWRSEDGLTWTVVAESATPIEALASGPAGSFAHTMPPDDDRDGSFADVPPIVLSSEDGLSWCSTEHEPFRSSAVQRSDVGPDGRVLAVGVRDSRFGPPLIWRGIPAGADGMACQPASSSGEEPEPFVLEPVTS